MHGAFSADLLHPSDDSRWKCGVWSGHGTSGDMELELLPYFYATGIREQGTVILPDEEALHKPEG